MNTLHPDDQVVPYFRYAPQADALYLWAPRPEPAPDGTVLWEPVWCLKLQTGDVQTRGDGTWPPGRTTWDAVKAALPADLGSQIRALQQDVAGLIHRQQELTSDVAALVEQKLTLQDTLHRLGPRPGGPLVLP